MKWHITAVSAITDHTFIVKFNDGTMGQVKFEPSFFRGVFAPLASPYAFEKVAIEHGTVTWSDDLDLAPDAIYADIKTYGVCVMS